MNTKELIHQYLEWGFNILPARDGGKYPVIGSWRRYQTERYPKEEIEKYLENGHKNWQVVCGAISQNLLVLDFDEPELYNKFKYAVPGRLLRTFIVKTGKKGYHIYFRTPEPIKATKMGAVDIQGEGKLAMIPPSVHPETKKRYEVIRWEEPLKLSKEELDLLMDTLKVITGKTGENEELINKIVEIILPYWRSGQRDNLEWPLLGYMRKHGIPFYTAKIILEKIINLTGDEEASMRMNNLERNYFKLSPEKLEGYAGLKEILQEQDLKLLEKYVKSLSGEDIPRNTPAGKKGKATKEKEEEEKIKKVPYIDLEDDLYLAVWDGKASYKFAHLARNGEIELLDSVEIDGITYLPREKGNLPVGYPTFEIMDAPDVDTITLFELLKSFIWQYVDMSNDDLEMAVFFILSTWFYRKANTTAYLRFLGDTGKGKSRMLKVIGDLCFYPVKVGGNATRSAIMRVQEMFHGTLIIDESDFKGDKENELTKYINSGFERNNPIIITNKNTYQIETYDPFSPKIFAMRHPFGDSATEGRLLSIEPYETHRKDIPAVLPLKYDKEIVNLRNILARWTLKNWGKVKMENMEVIQSLPIEPRLKQMATPLSIILPLFQDGQERSMKNKFTEWLLNRQKQIVENRKNSPEGLVFNAIVDLANGETEDLSEKFKDYLYNPHLDGQDYDYTEKDEGKPLVITTGMIVEMTGLYPKKVRKILDELGFKVVRKKYEFKGNKKNPHIVIMDNTQRWEEAWRRYRDFSSVGTIPHILIKELEQHTLTPRTTRTTRTSTWYTGIDWGDIDTLKDIIKNKNSAVRICAGSAGSPGSIPISLVFSPQLKRWRKYPHAWFRKGKLMLEMVPYEMHKKKLITAREDITYSTIKHGKEDRVFIKKWDVRKIPLKEAKILIKSGKAEGLIADFRELFKHVGVMEVIPEEMPQKVGQVVAVWET